MEELYARQNGKIHIENTFEAGGSQLCNPFAQFLIAFSDGCLLVWLNDNRQIRTKVARPIPLNKCNKWILVHGNRFAIPT